MANWLLGLVKFSHQHLDPKGFPTPWEVSCRIDVDAVDRECRLDPADLGSPSRIGLLFRIIELDL